MGKLKNKKIKRSPHRRCPLPLLQLRACLLDVDDQTVKPETPMPIVYTNVYEYVFTLDRLDILLEHISGQIHLSIFAGSVANTLF